MIRKKLEQADFGGGCFWGVEEAFRNEAKGSKTMVGYEGGHVDNPTYEQVCTHTTGHAETVRVEFDPDIINYDQLLDIFFKHHDPTQLNRQGPDIGENYRSVIFYHDDRQKEAAEKKIIQLEKDKKYNSPIVTQVVPSKKFWVAEEYHQQYLHKRNLGVCY